MPLACPKSDTREVESWKKQARLMSPCLTTVHNAFQSFALSDGVRNGRRNIFREDEQQMEVGQPL